MRIAVLVKQVPATDRVSVDPVSGTLRREGAEAMLNPFCEYALDLAARLKAAHGGEVTAITMGPPQARSALLRCLELGADRAVLLSDRAFAGSDVWATSRVLAKVLAKGRYDLILAGKQAVDGDTAQVPGEVAEALSIPSICYAEEVEVVGGEVRVRRTLSDVTEELSCPMPCLVTVAAGDNVRRVPSMADVLHALDEGIEVLGAVSLGISPSEVGAGGSLTRVIRVFSPRGRRDGRIVDGSDAVEAVEEVLRLLEGGHC